MSTTRIAASRTDRAQLAPIMEIFSSIQGEGLFVGEPQVFVRLRGCPLRCRYCDTPGSWSLRPASNGAQDEWLSPFQVVCRAAELEDGRARTISVTGGEPLLWPDFLFGLRSIARGRRIHLETAGAHPQTLARVLEAVDHVSLDLKLANDLDAPVPVEGLPEIEATPASDREWGEARRRSLALVRERDACGKIVVCGGTEIGLYEQLLDEVLELAPELPVFLQPATPMRDVEAPPMEDLFELANEALERELTVRVLPQVHRQMRIR